MVTVSACSPSGPSGQIPLSPVDGHEFEGTWTAAGDRQRITPGGERQASIAELEGPLLLAGKARPGLGFQARYLTALVHHVLVKYLVKTWERVFIHDPCACRKGKGAHAAVARLQQFMRQATANGTCEAWTLRLDIRNRFMTIDRGRELAMLDARLDARRADDADARWLIKS